MCRHAVRLGGRRTPGWRCTTRRDLSGFLVYDLNRVAQSRGATHGEAMLLAVSVYLDVFNLFLALLQLFDFARRDD